MNQIKQNSRKRRKGFVLHIHPPAVHGDTLKLSRTWGLGGMALVLFFIMVVTGILLLFAYEPHPVRAYDSILSLQKDILFGQFIRNIHHWSGNILAIVAFLHLLRVFFTGGFFKPRRLNWIIGLFLFFLILSSNFTGYLLPWDQLAFWAITICTSMLEYLPGAGPWFQDVIRDGETVGKTTLSIFFTFHVAIIPLCLLLTLPFHFWRVRKAGGVVRPVSDNDAKVHTIPNLVLRELVAGLILTAFILIFALIFNAPLMEKANPGLSPNPAKAPWYFAGLQEMLMHFHPLFSVWIIPGLMVCSLFVLPFIRHEQNSEGIWFYSKKGRQMGITAAVISIVITPVIILCSSFLVDFSRWFPELSVAVSNGLFPLIFIMAGIGGFYMLIKKRYDGNDIEAIQAVFILLLVAYIVLTITGMWFRGPGMALMWIW